MLLGNDANYETLSLEDKNRIFNQIDKQQISDTIFNSLMKKLIPSKITRKQSSKSKTLNLQKKGDVNWSLLQPLLTNTLRTLNLSGSAVEDTNFRSNLASFIPKGLKELYLGNTNIKQFKTSNNQPSALKVAYFDNCLSLEVVSCHSKYLEELSACGNEKLTSLTVESRRLHSVSLDDSVNIICEDVAIIIRRNSLARYSMRSLYYPYTDMLLLGLNTFTPSSHSNEWNSLISKTNTLMMADSKFTSGVFRTLIPYVSKLEAIYIFNSYLIKIDDVFQVLADATRLRMLGYDPEQAHWKVNALPRRVQIFVENEKWLKFFPMPDQSIYVALQDCLADFQPSSGQIIYSKFGSKGGITTMLVSGDKEKLYIATDRHEVYEGIWANMQEPRLLYRHQKTITFLGEVGRRVVSTSLDGSIHLQSALPEDSLTITNSEGIQYAALSGGYLFTYDTQKLSKWDLIDGQCLFSHKIEGVIGLISGRNKYVIVACKTNIKLWSSEENKVVCVEIINNIKEAYPTFVARRTNDVMVLNKRNKLYRLKFSIKQNNPGAFEAVRSSVFKFNSSVKPSYIIPLSERQLLFYHGGYVKYLDPTLEAQRNFKEAPRKGKFLVDVLSSGAGHAYACDHLGNALVWNGIDTAPLEYVVKEQPIDTFGIYDSIESQVLASHCCEDTLYVSIGKEVLCYPTKCHGNHSERHYSQNITSILTHNDTLYLGTSKGSVYSHSKMLDAKLMTKTLSELPKKTKITRMFVSKDSKKLFILTNKTIYEVALDANSEPKMLHRSKKPIRKLIVTDTMLIVLKSKEILCLYNLTTQIKEKTITRPDKIIDCEYSSYYNALFFLEGKLLHRFTPRFDEAKDLIVENTINSFSKPNDASKLIINDDGVIFRHSPTLCSVEIGILDGEYIIADRYIYYASERSRGKMTYCALTREAIVINGDSRIYKFKNQAYNLEWRRLLPKEHWTPKQGNAITGLTRFQYTDKKAMDNQQSQSMDKLTEFMRWMLVDYSVKVTWSKESQIFSIDTDISAQKDSHRLPVDNKLLGAINKFLERSFRVVFDRRAKSYMDFRQIQFGDKSSSSTVTSRHVTQKLFANRGGILSKDRKSMESRRSTRLDSWGDSKDKGKPTRSSSLVDWEESVDDDDNNNNNNNDNDNNNNNNNNNN